MGKQFKNRRNIESQNTKKEEHVKEEADEPKVEQQSPRKGKKEIQKNKGKKNRIIIRNLVFDVSDKHLRKLLLPFGQIKDIEIPKNPNNEKLNKGFAFVEFVNRRSGEKAIKDLNQSTFKGRSIVLDFSLSKQKFMTKKIENEQKIQDQNAKNEVKEPTKKEDEQESLNKEQQNNQQEVLEHKFVPNPDEDCSSTIFIRNLPPNIDEQQLKQFFARYGKVKWAKIVIDKETKTPKGTAFVKYADKDHAHNIIEYSRSYEMFLLGKLPRFRKDPRYSLQIQGTIVKIFPVQKRETIAQKLKQRAEAQAQDKTSKKLRPLKKMKKIDELIAFDKQGKRRINLAALGLWEPNEEMEQQDQQRFKAHYKQKIEKLKNPNYSVSDTRIILKFLDKSITEEQIKNLAHQFLRNVNLPPRQLSFCKLMLDKERQKSAGFAFLEFTHHQTSKNFVEALALHQSVLMKRPFVVEFALQDSRKLLKQKQRQ